MKLFGSLTNRIFLASAMLAVLAIAVAVYRVNVAVTRQAENELRRGLEEASTLLEEIRTTQFDHFSREARLVADLSNMKAALDTGDPITVRPIAQDYQRQIGCDLFLVTGPVGRVLAEEGRVSVDADVPAVREAIARALKGHEVVALWPYRGGVIQVATVPSFLQSELMGTVSVGFSLDEEAAARFKALTNSEIAFAAGNAVQASTLSAEFHPALTTLLVGSDSRRIVLGDTEYETIVRALPLRRPNDEGPAQALGGVPHAILLRSRTERLRFLNNVHRELAVTAILAVLAATLLSYAVARTITRPLGAITATMRDMAATGDLTRRIALPRGGGDDDARLLATTFNAMTDSIVRFQREAAQRERLSSLGRLSTVVAHEIRNPLMIIKTALRGLRRESVPPEVVRAAVADIDEETARLNRIVTEVLDFARPIKFEFAPADLNVLCEDAVRATQADGDSPAVMLRLDRGLPPVVTDAERLRIALVNILTNARHAVGARDASARAPDAITLTTRRVNGRCALQVSDRGNGIAPEDLPRVFDPYFTTRRTGTGLGLAITRNIIEGLGGTIAVQSRPGEGTDVRIELPLRTSDEVQRTHSR
jgi:signal transduction histidine kinase